VSGLRAPGAPRRRPRGRHRDHGARSGDPVGRLRSGDSDAPPLCRVGRRTVTMAILGDSAHSAQPAAGELDPDRRWLASARGEGNRFPDRQAFPPRPRRGAALPLRADPGLPRLRLVDLREGAGGRQAAQVEVAYPEAEPFWVAAAASVYKRSSSELTVRALLPAPLAGQAIVPVRVARTPQSPYGSRLVAAIPKLAGGTASLVYLGSAFPGAASQRPARRGASSSVSPTPSSTGNG